MNSSKIVYWSLIALMVLTSTFGIWGAFFADDFLTRKGEIAEKRLGKKAVGFFQSALRILSVLLAVLSLYLLFNLCRVFQCAIR